MRAPLLLSLVPLILSSQPADRDGDGWPDAEEVAMGFLPDDARSHPPAPRYAPADLGSIAERGWPVALSDERHRVLTDRGHRWSWQAGWERLTAPPRADHMEFGVIRSDGAVLARVESSEEGLPTTAIWRWDTTEAPKAVPRTLHRYVPDDAPAPWLLRPLRWLRGDGFLLSAEPIVLEPGPLGVDILVGDASAGVPTPTRRTLSPLAIANGVGERWVADFDSPDGTWRLDGHASRLPIDIEPVAWSDDGAMLLRHQGGLRLDEPGVTPWTLPFSSGVSRAALVDAPGSLRAVVALAAAEPLVWDIDAGDRDIRPPDSLVHLVARAEGWSSLHPVAVDRAGAILAVGHRQGGAPRIVLLVPLRVRADLPRQVDELGLRAGLPLDARGFTSEGRPLRLWVNDDRDEGSVTPDPLADLPGQSKDPRANFRRQGVGGTSDLVDWFPVALKLGSAAEDLPPFDIRLVGPVQLVNALETSLPVSRAAQFLQRDLGTAHGPRLDQALAAATKSRALPGGIALSPAFAQSAVGRRLLGRGEAVFLLEGAAFGSGTLWVTLVRRGTPVDRPPQPADILLRAPLRVAVGPVDAFHRTWNARQRTPSAPSEPTLLPDLGQPGPWVVFIHGFNVGPEPGLAWGAEIFKRFHQAGSSARFIAYRWYGDQGAPNYGSAVECAPAAADRLCQQLAALANADPGRQVVLVGHSLGAYVALLAAEPSRLPAAVPLRACVLVNAALPAEALDPAAWTRPADYAEGAGQPVHLLMTPPGSVWRDTPPFSLAAAHAAHWAGHFPPTDRRSACRWIGRFPDAARVINLYSRTEDVLSPPPSEDARWPGVLAVSGHGAWIYQEAGKGRWPGRWVNPSRSQAGWSLAPLASRRASAIARTAGARQVALLRGQPLFADFRERALHDVRVGPSTPGSLAVDRPGTILLGLGSASLPPGSRWSVRDELLAHALPALSPAAGSVPVAGVRNYRMDGLGSHDPDPAGLRPFPLGWPSGVEAVDHLDAPAAVWRHSDWRNVAFPHVHPVFAYIVREAGLGAPDLSPP